MLSNRKLAALVAALIVLSALAGVLLWLYRPHGSQVVVTVNGTVYASYDLYTDRTVVLGPDDGSWYNTLQIEDGTARLSASDCANQICVHTPAISEEQPGMIICLPHALVVELREE